MLCPAAAVARGFGEQHAARSTLRHSTTTCRTIRDAVAQARRALRSFRERRGRPDADAAASANDAAPAVTCCRIQLPVPHPGDKDTVKLLDAQDFPGGVQQLTRAVVPLVDDLLDGFVTADHCMPRCLLPFSFDYGVTMQSQRTPSLPIEYRTQHHKSAARKQRSSSCSCSHPRLCVQVRRCRVRSVRPQS